MSKELELIRPKKRPRLMDLVNAAGVDVRDWANSKRGAKGAASNPKYCYEWSFLESGKVLVLCIWHKEMHQEGEKVVYLTSPRAIAEKFKGVPHKDGIMNRGLKMDQALQSVFKDPILIRAIVVDGDTPPPGSFDAAKVRTRLLDPVPWRIEAYDQATGECRLVRSQSAPDASNALGASPIGVLGTQATEGSRGSEVFPFKPGHQYTRAEIQRLIGIPETTGGDFFTGYTQVGEDFFVFCGIGAPGRTGHQYFNSFDGDELVWHGKTKSRLHQRQIQDLISPGRNVYVFFREDERDPFTFAGLGTPVQTEDTEPVLVRWTFNNGRIRSATVLPEEVINSGSVIEGAKKTITVNVYERNPAARVKCLARWGCTCQVCGFNFEQVYGELGAGFIHVHHLKPLGEIGESYVLNPIEDLRPVCPNCHAILHRGAETLKIEALKQLLEQRVKTSAT